MLWPVNSKANLKAEIAELRAKVAAYEFAFSKGKLYGTPPSEGEDDEMYWIILHKHVNLED